MKFIWGKEPLQSLSENGPDLELKPELLAPIPMLDSLKTSPHHSLTLRAGLRNLWLAVEGMEEMPPGMLRPLSRGTYLLDPLRFQGPREEVVVGMTHFFLRGGLVTASELREERDPFQHRACSIIY